MPVVVTGLKEAQKAMRSLQPDLEKNMKVEIKGFLIPVVRKARGYAPSSISGLSNWLDSTKRGQISAKTSLFRKGHFPFYNPTIVRSGIKPEIFPVRHKGSGFISLVRVVNSSAAGAIFETAGRKNPAGQPWDKHPGQAHDLSHSRNPNAGKHFVIQIGNVGKLTGSNATRGRLIYRAFAEDQGKALGHILTAINKTSLQSKKLVDNARATRRAA
jgi:hypothetical protein